RGGPRVGNGRDCPLLHGGRFRSGRGQGGGLQEGRPRAAEWSGVGLEGSGGQGAARPGRRRADSDRVTSGGIGGEAGCNRPPPQHTPEASPVNASTSVGERAAGRS